MNKGLFSGTRRNTRSAVDQGVGLDSNVFFPAEDDPLSIRNIFFGFNPPHSRFKTKTSGVQRRYPVDVQEAAFWVTQTSNFGTTTINSIAYGNNLWVAGGNVGQLRTSTDAVTWTTQTSNFGTTTIQSIAYGNSLWVAGGNATQLRTSTDAVTWTTQTSNFGATVINSIAYGNNIWVAAGDTVLGAGQLRTSTDAVTWTAKTSNFDTTGINSVAYGNNTWVAAGATGELRTCVVKSYRYTFLSTSDYIEYIVQ